ncbi:MAG: fumarylacetoacetate hydrolase family protein [Candidatus Thermoplasmatota archaeon]
MKILCVARNYASHARELGNPMPPAPLWFWKPESCLLGDGEPITLPAGIGAVHHEVELAVRLGHRLRRATGRETLAAVADITVANDLTARELQDAAKKNGTPWAQAKGYDGFLPLGAWVPYDGRDLQDLRLRLWVGDELRQDATTRDMSWGVADLLAHASAWTTLEPGDILLTGTPAGIGPLVAGRDVRCEIAGVATLRNPVVSE